jgi:hypothetical protein
MAVVKKKEKTEVEHLRGENRRLKSVNRNLQKRLRQLEKKEHLFDDIEVKVEDDVIEEKKKCNKCKVGVITTVDLGRKIMYRCTKCQYRITKEK